MAPALDDVGAIRLYGQEHPTRRECRSAIGPVAGAQSPSCCRFPGRECMIRSCLTCRQRTRILPVKIHEYQAKAVLARFGVPVPRGEVTFSADNVADISRKLGGGVSVVKAQIHAGGRGKGGGVKVAKSPEEAHQLAQSILGMTLVTHQTG